MYRRGFIPGDVPLKQRSSGRNAEVARKFFFFKQKTAYEIGLGIPAEPLFRSGYYTVKDCVTIDVLPRTPGNNVYVGFMVWSNFTATKCRGLVSLNQVIKEIICLQPLK